MHVSHKFIYEVEWWFYRYLGQADIPDPLHDKNVDFIQDLHPEMNKTADI